MAPNGIPGAAVALAAIFLPSFLLVIGLMPLLAQIRERPALRGAMAGAGAAVIGLLMAAFYDPVLIGAVESPLDAALAALALLALVLARIAPYLVVGALAAAGELVAQLSIQVA